MREIRGSDQMYVEFEAEYVHKTSRGLLVNYEGEEFWLPLSETEWSWSDGAMVEITIPRWLAEKKGLIK